MTLPVPAARRWSRRAPVAACLAAGLSLVAAGELMHVNRPAPVPSASPARRIPPPAPAIAPTNAPAARASASPASPSAGSEVARAETEDHIRPGQIDSPTSRTAPARRPPRLAPAPAPERGAPGSGASLVHTLGSRDHPVFSPAFGSNGTPIFFHSGSNTNRASALLAAGDDLRVMTIVDDGSRNYHVQPSPDGSAIAFDSDRDGDRGVYLARRDGSNVRRISGPGFAAVPTWSPDARQLAFVRAEPSNAAVWNLWLMTLATGETRRLTSFRYGQTWSASWFPDGARVAYAHEDRLLIQDLGTGRAREFASPIPRRLVRTPAVSPDGSKIVFQVYRSGVWLLDLSDASTRCILQDPTAEEFAWAPDGLRIAFHSRRDGQWGIWTMSSL